MAKDEAGSHSSGGTGCGGGGLVKAGGESGRERRVLGVEGEVQ